MSKESNSYKNSPKKVYIRTFGCQMNAADSERMKSVLAREGYVIAPAEESADVVLLNTCSVRRMAEEKVWSRLGELHKKRGESVVLGLTGCMAQLYKDRAFERAPYLNIVCGTRRFHRIGRLIEEAYKNKNGRVQDVSTDAPIEEDIPRDAGGGVCAWVPVSRGCSNNCSYCIVPRARGAERNRPPQSILKEIRTMAENGCKEVTLLGQNVNSYKSGRCGFPGLLEMVNGVGGIERIRFVTSHPKDAGIELFAAVKSLRKVCEYLHLPAQSGSSRILEKMNRRYTRNDYLKVISGVRDLMPEAGISTDIIVGFPGETDEDFEDTYRLLEEVEFDSAFIFKYSPRPGTLSAALSDDIVPDVKKERNRRLLELQDKISLKKNKALEGSVLEILVEGLSKNNKNRLMGRTRTNKIVVFEGPVSMAGSIAHVRINEAGAHTMYGEICSC